jgi:endonuclease/exonuclease/phosphatase family metal-dependent hydrolase
MRMPRAASFRRWRVLALFSLSVLFGAGCSTAVMRLEPGAPACPGTRSAEVTVRWLALSDPDSVKASRQWCEAVGPVATGTVPPDESRPERASLLVVAWNVAVGAGDVEQLLRTLTQQERRAGREDPDFILLLQETYRAGEAVPVRYGSPVRIPSRIAAGERHGRDVVSLATRLGMNFLYVPSMRNGEAATGEAAEDRGNAILSTLPLRDVTAIELPLEHQRRVAVAATVQRSGSVVTVVSVHLDTRRDLSRGSIFAGPAARHRQAAALVDAISGMGAAGPVIVAGDFNTFAGPREPAIRSIEKRFDRVSCGSPLTHRWRLQLDYVFTSEPELLSSCDRLPDRFESDHHPLVARVRLSNPTPVTTTDTARLAAPR